MRVSLAWLGEEIENIKNNSPIRTNLTASAVATDKTKPVDRNVEPSGSPSLTLILSTHAKSKRQAVLIFQLKFTGQ